MTTPEQKLVEQQIAEVKARLAEAQARVPKHDVPAALIDEIDELDMELERLQSLAAGAAEDEGKPLEERIAEREQRLADANARVPKHDVPAALIAELDDLEEELEHLRSLRGSAS